MKNIKYIISIVSLIFLVSCEPELNDGFDPSPGDADFTHYVSLGNSLTAGFSDGALYQDAQIYSFPNILAYHFEFVGGGEFKLPLMPTNEGVGVEVTTQGMKLTTKYILGFKEDCKGELSMAPVLENPDISQEVLQQRLLTPISADGPFNNLGIPGIKSFHALAPGLGLLNPYMGRLAVNPATDVLLNMALEQQPTFFTIWLGSNDVLGFALEGGTGDSITSQALFNGSLETIIGNMAGNSKGAIANIPDIKVIPFFNTVPYNSIVLTDQNDVNALNAAYYPLNQQIKALGSNDTIAFSLGANPMVIEDLSLDWNIRQIKSNELVLLSIPQDSLKCYGLGTQIPVRSKHILIANEIEMIDAAVSGYNLTIKNLANQYDLAHVDVYSELNYYNTHTVYIDGIPFNTEFITGNIFSLDGIHLCPRGNALMASEFIKAINMKYNANIPEVIISAYPGIEFPD